MKMKKRIGVRHIAIGIAMLVLLIWLMQVIYINIYQEATNYKYYDLGKSFEYKGYDITVVDWKLYTLDEFINNYGIDKTSMGYIVEDIDYRICVAIMDFSKKSDIYQTIDEGTEYIDQSLLLGYFDMMLVADADSYCADPTLDVLMKNSMTNKINQMKIGERQNIEIAYLIPFSELSKKYADELEKHLEYIQLQDYKGSPYIRRVRLK